MSSVGNFFPWWATTVISYVINYVVDLLCHQWATSFLGVHLLSLVMTLIMWWANNIINGQLLSLVGHYCH